MRAMVWVESLTRHVKVNAFMSKIFQWLVKPQVLLWAIGVVLTLSMIVIVYGIFHGFDWTDEAWAFSVISSGRTTLEAPWAYQYLVGPLLQLFGGTVITTRLIRLVAFVALAAFTAFMTIRIATARGVTFTKPTRALVYLVAQFGTLLIWSWPPRNFAYNELASIGVQFTVFILAFLLLTADPKPVWRDGYLKRFLLVFATAAVLGLIFYAKFTVAVILAPALLVVAVWRSPARRIVSAIAAVGGLIVGFAIPILFGARVGEYLQRIVEILFDEEVRTANAHSDGLAQMYVQDVVSNFSGVMPVALLFLAAVVASASIIRERQPAEGTLARLSILVFFFVAIQVTFYLRELDLGGEKTGRFAIVMAVGAAILLWFSTWRPVRGILDQKPFAHEPRMYVSIGLISVAPILVSLGTNNPLSVHLAIGSTTWTTMFGFALVIYVFFLQKNSPKISSLPFVLGLVASVLAFGLVLHDAKGPYRSTAFWKNTATIENAGVLAGIKVTPQEAEWADWVIDRAKALGAEDVPTISLKSPGALLIFNNSPFVNPWLEDFWPASFWSIPKACADGAPDDLIILQPGEVTEDTPEFRKVQDSLMSSCGLNLQEDFDLVANRKNSDPRYAMKIWRLQR